MMHRTSWNCFSRYRSTKFRAIAIHEAGHAVFSVVLGFSFTRVRIYPEIHPVPPGGATLGEIVFDRNWPEYACPGPRFHYRKALAYYTRDGCMTLAGPLAEAQYSGRALSLFSGPAMEGTDAAYVRTLGDVLGMSELELRAWVAQISAIDLELLHDPAIWAAVQSVANALFERRTLAAREVLRIVAGFGRVNDQTQSYINQIYPHAKGVYENHKRTQQHH